MNERKSKTHTNVRERIRELFKLYSYKRKGKIYPTECRVQVKSLAFFPWQVVCCEWLRQTPWIGLLSRRSAEK